LTKISALTLSGYLARGKLADFVDRIDCILRIPPTTQKMLGAKHYVAELEDLCCMLIRKHFEDADHIGTIALELLTTELKKPNSVRKVEKIIFSSHPPVDKHFDIFRIHARDRMGRMAASADDNAKLEPSYVTIKIHQAADSDV
jgi:hypothetical protein